MKYRFTPAASRGMTLVEMMIIVAVIIILTITLNKYQANNDSAYDSERDVESSYQRDLSYVQENFRSGDFIGRLTDVSPIIEDGKEVGTTLKTDRGFTRLMSVLPQGEFGVVLYRVATLSGERTFICLDAEKPICVPEAV